MKAEAIDQASVANTAATCHIKKVVLRNFRKFEKLTLEFNRDLNVLVGDNEVGKSTVLLALDLTLSASRSKIETIGIDSLLSKDAVVKFLAGEKSASDLPALAVDVFLSELPNWETYGRTNSLHEDNYGLRFTCEPALEDYGDLIEEVLRQRADNFPFEFYTIKFQTFAGQPYGGRRRYLQHLLIDSAQINTEYAHREYTRKLFQANATVSERHGLENKYRQAKQDFWGEHLSDLNAKLEVSFWVRSSSKSNLETDLLIVKDGLPIENKGRGQQSLIKTEFALQRGKGEEGLGLVLLEEPENHLSHANMRALLDRITSTSGKQLIVSTHNSLICSRLDLRKTILLDRSANPLRLKDLDEPTADFFCKAPDHNVLEFALSRRVLLVEGDAEYILISALYEICTKSTLDKDRVHVIAVGGTSFKRYLALAKVLNIRAAVVRDNDGNYEQTCVENYEGFLSENSRVFADTDPQRNTFEVALYLDNQAACEELFGKGRKTLTVQQFMLNNKAEAALALLTAKGDKLSVPKYLSEAMLWIRE